MSDVLARLLERQKTSPFPGSAGWARALDGKASFADPGSAQAGFDAGTATARFLITSARKDRHGDVVLPKGCVATLGDYAANPVVFFGHDSSGLPIGSCKNADGSLGLEFAEEGIYGRVKFHLKTRVSEEVAALVEADEVRGSSIGFLPKEAELHEGKIEELDEGSKLIKFQPFVSFTFTLWDLLEWSVCSVPANGDALRRRLEKGIGGKPLSDEVKRLILPFVEAGKVWSPGATFKPAEAGDATAAGTATESGAAPAVGGELTKGESTPRRAPRKPGELFFARTLSEIDRHRDHYARGMDDQEHPEVSGYCKDAAAAMDRHRKKTQSKAEEVYPEVDFSMAPSAACEAGTAADTEVDMVKIQLALNELLAAQAATSRKFKLATGKV